MSRRSPAPAASEAGNIASDAPIAPNAPAEAAAPVADTRVRVISPSHGHAVDAVVMIAGGDVEEAERLGWADSRPESIAEAEQLHALHRANQGFEKRVQFTRD